MSRIGLAPIEIPSDVKVTIEDGGNFGYKKVIVEGPKGKLEESLRRGVTVEITDSVINLSRESESKQNKAFHGLYRSLINNMVQGVKEGYSRELEIIGIGYRAEVQGNTVVFSLGYAHKINYDQPEGITITIEEQTKIKVEGADKQKVGEVASKIRAFRKPEPYKGKGIRYKDEQVKRKSAKSVSG